MSNFGELDKNLRNKYRGHWLVCPKGHLNSPNAKICDKCGSEKLHKEGTHPNDKLMGRTGE